MSEEQTFRSEVNGVQNVQPLRSVQPPRSAAPFKFPLLNPPPRRDCVAMQETTNSVISNGSERSCISATYKNKISPLRVEMTIATQSVFAGEGRVRDCARAQHPIFEGGAELTERSLIMFAQLRKRANKGSADGFLRRLYCARVSGLLKQRMAAN
jgi:hypothetical protein